MRKHLRFLMMAAAILFVNVAKAADDVTVGDFTFNFYTSGNAYVTSYLGSETSLTLPVTITYNKEGKDTTVNVTGIGPSAFAGNTTLETLYLPRNGSYTVGVGAFKGCTALNTIAYSYEGASDSYTRENYITHPSSTINDSVYEGCTSIQNLYGRYYMTGGIGDNAFKGCTSLGYASISARCPSIGESAFEGCSALERVIGCAYKSTASDKTYYTSTTIGAKAFKDCTSLNYFGSSATYLGSNSNTRDFTSVVSIGDNAFENCAFTVAYFHRVESVGAEAFKGCANLQNVYVIKADGDYNILKDGDSDITEITLGEGAFENCASLIRLRHVEYARGEGNSLVATYLPSTLFTAIPARAFKGCSALTTIGGTGKASTTETTTSSYLGACLPLATSIGESAFEGCSALKFYIKLDTTKPTIGDKAFMDCLALERVGNVAKTFTLDMPQIGMSAFEGCAVAEAIVFTEDVTSIGPRAFAKCEALTTVTAPWTTPFAIENSVFSYATYTNATLNVPEGAEATYQATGGWLNFYDTTGIKLATEDDALNGNDAWYTIDGKRLQAEPTTKGIYVRGGKKIVVK